MSEKPFEVGEWVLILRSRRWERVYEDIGETLVLENFGLINRECVCRNPSTDFPPKPKRMVTKTVLAFNRVERDDGDYNYLFRICPEAVNLKATYEVPED